MGKAKRSPASAGDLEVRLAILEERSRNEREALLVARSEINRRLEGMNELRDQINTERGSYIGKTEIDALEDRFNIHFQSNRDLIISLDKRVTTIETNEAAGRRFTAIAVGTATFIISIVVAIANNLI